MYIMYAYIHTYVLNNNVVHQAKCCCRRMKREPLSGIASFSEWLRKDTFRS